MVSTAFKPAVSKVIQPIALAAHRAGVTPDIVTLVGTVGGSFSSLYFFSRGDFFIGTLLVSLFALSDLFDGAIARASDVGPSKWGGFLDSTCDRITDASLLAGVAIYLVSSDDPLLPIVLASIVTGSLVPYIRARAEAFGIECSVGIAERTERIVIALTAIGLDGLCVPYALAIGIWFLFIASAITVAQRMIVVRRGLLAHE
jgi:CDP-diacylglycerol--glycerol-3-phosphate 3-phosphatidyltransferase